MGTSSIVIPMVPLHSISAAKHAPKDQGGKAVAGATVGGYVGHVPSLAYAGYKIHKALKKKENIVPVERRLPPKAQSRFDKKFEMRYNKRYQKTTAGKATRIWKKLKRNLSAGDLKKMMALQVVGQGVGAGIGYARSTDYSKKTKKSK